MCISSQTFLVFTFETNPCVKRSVSNATLVEIRGDLSCKPKHKSRIPTNVLVTNWLKAKHEVFKLTLLEKIHRTAARRAAYTPSSPPPAHLDTSSTQRHRSDTNTTVKTRPAPALTESHSVIRARVSGRGRTPLRFPRQSPQVPVAPSHVQRLARSHLGGWYMFTRVNSGSQSVTGQQLSCRFFSHKIADMWFWKKPLLFQLKLR